jgi:L-asparaginase II
MTANPYLPILEITRGQIVESIHYGAVVVVNSYGATITSYGSSQAITFLRSSAKPFQAIPLIENGGAEVYSLSSEEIAIICGSHSGTDEHFATIRGIQTKVGITEADLLCGVHAPFHQPTVDAMRQRGENPTPNRHNCSGKHTGMLAYWRLKQLKTGAPETEIPYVAQNHPIQKDILEAFAEMCELPVNEVEIGIDGCSVPTFAVSLQNAAYAYARLCEPEQLGEARAIACRKITSSMTSYPEMVGGPDSFDTQLMRVAKGRIVSKGGAEGFQALGLLPGALGEGSPALGITIKVSDGDLGAHSRSSVDSRGHARPAITLSVLQQLGALSKEELSTLGEFGPYFTVHNWRKIVVGEARPCFTLNGTF